MINHLSLEIGQLLEKQDKDSYFIPIIGHLQQEGAKGAVNH